jgi:hypothetical protein
MKVRELLAKLQQQDGEMEVLTQVGNEYQPARSVYVTDTRQLVVCDHPNADLNPVPVGNEAVVDSEAATQREAALYEDTMPPDGEPAEVHNPDTDDHVRDTGSPGGVDAEDTNPED